MTNPESLVRWCPGHSCQKSSDGTGGTPGAHGAGVGTPPTPDLPGLGPCPRLGHGPWFESLFASALQALPMQGSASCIIRAQRGERAGQALPGGFVLCSSSQVQAHLQAHKAKLGTVYSLMLCILGKNMRSSPKAKSQA